MKNNNEIENTNDLNSAGSRSQILWLPVIVGVLLLILVFALWQSLKSEERQEKDLKLTEQGLIFMDKIESDLLNRISAVERMASRWEVRGGTPEVEFREDAQHYYNDLPGFQAIEWVDKDYVVRWVIPETGNEQAINLDLAFEDTRRNFLGLAKEKKTPTMSPPIDLVQGGKGFLVYFPIFIDKEFDGFILMVIEMEQWLIYLAEQNMYDIEPITDYSIFINDEEVFTKMQNSEQMIYDEATISRQIYNDTFTIKHMAINEFVEENTSLLPDLTAAVGFFLSLLISFAIYLSQKTNHESWVAHSTKSALELEISNHNKTESKMEDINSRLILATQAGGIGIWEWNIVTGHLKWNDIMFDLYDVSQNVLPTYNTWKNSIHPDDVVRIESELNDSIEGHSSFYTEFRLLSINGEVKFIRTAAQIKRGTDGKPLLMIGVNWDITSSKEAEIELNTERRRLAGILKGTNVGTWEWNVQTGDTIFNERWANIIGYNLSEISPTNIDTWTSYAHPDDLVESGKLLEMNFNKKLPYYECEARMKHKDGHWVWVLDRGQVTSWTEDGKPLLMSGTHAEITRRKNNEEQILHMASHDALTDLPSLKLAQDRLNMAISLARRNKYFAAVLFIDLDGFKSINDTYGHDAGDAVLIEVAKRLKSCIRDTDTAARIGGDEFLILLTELKASEDASEIAKKVIESISLAVSFKNRNLVVGASIGISLFPDHGDNVETLIKEADNAMYRIKKSGKNNYTFAKPH